VADLALLQVVLQEIAPVVHPPRWVLIWKIDPLRELVDFAEDLLELLAAEQVVKLAAPHRNQEEYVPHHNGSLSKRAQRLSRSAALWRLMVVCTWMGRPASLAQFDGLDGARPKRREDRESCR